MANAKKSTVTSEHIARAKTADSKRAILGKRRTRPSASDPFPLLDGYKRESRIKRLVWWIVPRALWAASFALVGFGIACLTQ